MCLWEIIHIPIKGCIISFFFSGVFFYALWQYKKYIILLENTVEEPKNYPQNLPKFLTILIHLQVFRAAIREKIFYLLQNKFFISTKNLKILK